MKNVRMYQPLWNNIKRDFEKYLAMKEADPTITLPYIGTRAYDIPPSLAARVDKAVRKEKNWNTRDDQWKYKTETKLTTTYDPTTFSMLFRLEAARPMEVISALIRRNL